MLPHPDSMLVNTSIPRSINRAAFIRGATTMKIVGSPNSYASFLMPHGRWSVSMPAVERARCPYQADQDRLCLRGQVDLHAEGRRGRQAEEHVIEKGTSKPFALSLLASWADHHLDTLALRYRHDPPTAFLVRRPVYTLGSSSVVG